MTKSPQIQKRRSARKAQIIAIVRDSPDISRSLLQKRTHLSMETVLELVEELLQEGLLRECGKSESPVGRKAVMLRVRPEGWYSVGVRYNARFVTGVAMDFACRAVTSVRTALPEGLDRAGVIGRLEHTVDEVLAALGERRVRVAGIGIGTPGTLSQDKEVVERYIHIPDWRNVPLKQILEARYGLPVQMDQGVRCTARALHALPEYAACRDMLLLQQSRGIVVGLVADGRVYDGGTRIAGEIGHICLTGNDRLCACGARGCLETVASEGAVLARVAEGRARGRFALVHSEDPAGGSPPMRAFLDAAARGDADCLALLSEVGDAIGCALAMAVTLFNPVCLVVMGAMADFPTFRAALLSALDKRALREARRALRVDFRSEDDVFDALGAARLPYARLLEGGAAL